MRVFIFAEGGKGIGLGHITRCIAIYQALHKTGAHSTLVISKRSRLQDFLRKRGVEYISIGNERDVHALYTQDDIVIIDSYLLPREFYNKVGKKARLTVSLDDFKRMEYPKGIVVNGSVNARDIAYPKKENVRYLLGAKYVPLRNIFWNVKIPGQKRKIKKVLIIFGGFNAEFAYDMADYLLRSSGFSLILLPGADSRGSEFKHSRRLKVYKRLRDRDIVEVMQEADIAVCGGGQTTYELARLAKPAIGICFADNQLGNLTGWDEVGYMKYIGWYSDKDIREKTLRALRDISFEERSSMSENGKKYVDGLGAIRLAEEVLK